MKYKNIPIKSRVTEAKKTQPVEKYTPEFLSLKQKADVLWRIQQEGFDYAFRHYSSFDEVKDPKFHQLRRQYVKAADDLEKYLHKGFSPDQLEAIENEVDPFDPAYDAWASGE